MITFLSRNIVITFLVTSLMLRDDAFRCALQVGKKDQLKKFRTGQAESNSLNRRDLDVAMREWARLNRDKVGVNVEQKLDAFTKVGHSYKALLILLFCSRSTACLAIA